MSNPRGFLDADIRRVIRHYWRIAGAHPVHVAIPLALTFLTAALEGASYSLLIPLSEALSENSFDFLRESKLFGWVPTLLPAGALSSPRRDAYLALLILGLVVLARTGKVLGQFGKALYVHWRDETYYARVQERTFARVLGFGRQYFDGQSLGRLDVELGWSRAAVDLLASVEDFLKNVLSMVAKAVVMVALSVPLSLTVVVVFPAIVLVMGRISREIERLARVGAAVEVRTKSQVLDLLATVPLVKAFSQERQATASYADILGEARGVTMRRRNMTALRWPVEEILVLATVVAMQAVLILTAESFVPGDLARLAVFLLLVQQILPNLKCFGDFGMAVAEQRPKLRALATLFSDDEKYVVSSGDRDFHGLREGIRVRDLSFAYADGTPVLRGVSAEIPAHALTAVVGESGAGKSTFADLIARFYDCPAGSILLDDVDIRAFSLPSLYRRMAMVSQDVWLLNRTLRDNLVFGLQEPPEDRTLLDLLADVQLDTLLRDHQRPLDLVLGDRGVHLSGGQRQRIALARALLRDPDILILDEATSALDSIVERKVAEAIDRRFRGRTLLVIAHRLSTLRGADHILVFKEGRLVEEGSWDALLSLRGEFARLYEAQFEEERV
ncbi:MAG TPA: ABC transporter ATP-binding protein [Longimicrobiales bacterium]|nr:ABC transporter ATP-binding protein [Longimicrobiales bacterium]